MRYNIISKTLVKYVFSKKELMQKMNDYLSYDEFSVFDIDFKANKNESLEIIFHVSYDGIINADLVASLACDIACEYIISDKYNNLICNDFGEESLVIKEDNTAIFTIVIEYEENPESVEITD